MTDIQSLRVRLNISVHCHLIYGYPLVSISDITYRL